MDCVLAGKLECAIIREIDEVNRPHFNHTENPYYLSLNRRTDRSFFDRASTFITIFDGINIPVADWSAEPPYRENGLNADTIGVGMVEGRFMEAHAYPIARKLIDANFLSDSAFDYISEFDITDVPAESRIHIESSLDEIRRSIAIHYLARLITQIETARWGVFLVADEQDLCLIKEIGDYISATETPIVSVFPKISEEMILRTDFAGGLLNFSPPDVLSLAAIRTDPIIRQYAISVQEHIIPIERVDQSIGLVQSMRNSYKEITKLRKVDSLFEISSWIAKPIGYIPGIGNLLNVAQDGADVGQKALQRRIQNREWYLIAARATQIGIEDYLGRKGNL